MASFDEPKQRNGSRKSAMVGVCILASPFGYIGAKDSVIDAAACLAVDEGFDPLDAGGSKDPAGDDNGFPGDKDGTAVWLVESTNNPSRFESVVVDFKRRRELGPDSIGCGDADSRLVHAV